MPAPQHVIWITADHLRCDSLGTYGSAYAHTPTIDRLAANGVVFENAIAQSPVCMPSRASFMTGCYPHQVGVISNGPDLDPDHPLTVARCMRGAGFQTAQIGKLHFQHHEDVDLDPRARHDYGFDVFWCDEEPGCYAGPYLRWLASEDSDLVDKFRVPRPTSPERGDEARKPRVVDASWRHSFSGWIAEQTNRYLHSWGGSRGRQNRQFVHAGFYAPHPPLNPTADMLEPLASHSVPPPVRQANEAADKPGPLGWALEQQQFDDDTIENYRRHFAAMVTGIDFAVNDMLEKLEQAGVLDDTLIIISSDHGDFNGDHGLVSKGPAWYEGVCRVPLIMHWPKGLAGGQRESGIVELVDILPTALGLCDTPVPSAMAGQDWSPWLRGVQNTAIGKSDAFAVHEDHLLLRGERWKYIRYNVTGPESQEVLFDLLNDPHEFTNCVNNPDCQNELEHCRSRSLQRLMSATRPLNPKVFRF